MEIQISRNWNPNGSSAGGSAEPTTVEVDLARPKYYVLDMFPYPSGAGLHVGHPLGYIASDIFARFKRQCGFNVLQSDGLLSAFGLPAEQYAVPERDSGRPSPPNTTWPVTANSSTRSGFWIRLGPRSAHLRPGLLQVDAVGLPENVRQLLLPRQAAGAPDRGAGRGVRAAAAPKG